MPTPIENVREYLFAAGKNQALALMRTVTLADGFEVQLNTNTAVHVNLGRRERAVTRERGDGFFASCATGRGRFGRGRSHSGVRARHDRVVNQDDTRLSGAHRA